MRARVRMTYQGADGTTYTEIGRVNNPESGVWYFPFEKKSFARKLIRSLRESGDFPRRFYRTPIVKVVVEKERRYANQGIDRWV